MSADALATKKGFTMRSKYHVPAHLTLAELRERRRSAASLEYRMRAIAARDRERCDFAAARQCDELARYWRGDRAAVERRIRAVELAELSAAAPDFQPAPHAPRLTLRIVGRELGRIVTGDRALAAILSLWILGAVAIASAQ